MTYKTVLVIERIIVDDVVFSEKMIKRCMFDVIILMLMDVIISIQLSGCSKQLSSIKGWSISLCFSEDVSFSHWMFILWVIITMLVTYQVWSSFKEVNVKLDPIHITLIVYTIGSMLFACMVNPTHLSKDFAYVYMHRFAAIIVFIVLPFCLISYSIISRVFKVKVKVDKFFHFVGFMKILILTKRINNYLDGEIMFNELELSLWIFSLNLVLTFLKCLSLK